MRRAKCNNLMVGTCDLFVLDEPVQAFQYLTVSTDTLVATTPRHLAAGANVTLLWLQGVHVADVISWDCIKYASRFEIPILDPFTHEACVKAMTRSLGLVPGRVNPVDSDVRVRMSLLFEAPEDARGHPSFLSRGFVAKAHFKSPIDGRECFHTVASARAP